jgi:predicted phage-related endonuclease
MTYVTPFRLPITLVKALLNENRGHVQWSRLKGSVDMAQGSDEWHELRKSSIGSSEAAAVFPGISKTTTTGELFAKLCGTPKHKVFDSYIVNAMEAGKRMEPLLRAEMSSLLGRPIYEAGIFHATHESLPVTLSASPDGLITDEDGLVTLLEIKWRMASSDWAGDLGDTVFCQVQHQMYVLGLASAYVYCGCDGERSLWLVRWAPDYFSMWLSYAHRLIDQATNSPKRPRTEAGLTAQIASFLHRYKREHVERVLVPRQHEKAPTTPQ